MTKALHGARRRTTLLEVLGRICILAGVVLVLFAGFEFVGTTAIEQSSQRTLREALAPHLPASLVPDASLVYAHEGVRSQIGAPLGLLAIPAIGLRQVIVQGTNDIDLEAGPGHYPATVDPGVRGNAAIAGHRTTWGRPFYLLDQLKAGDKIRITTSQGRFIYAVAWTKVVQPNAVWVADPTPTAVLTLTTCNPRYSAAQRLVVRATLVETEHLAAGASAPISTSAPVVVVATPANTSLWVLWAFAMITIAIYALFSSFAQAASSRTSRRVLMVASWLCALVPLWWTFTALATVLPHSF